jgi:hypothetical protein
MITRLRRSSRICGVCACVCVRVQFNGHDDGIKRFAQNVSFFSDDASPIESVRSRFDFRHNTITHTDILTFEEKNYNKYDIRIIIFYFILHEHRKLRDFLDGRPCNCCTSSPPAVYVMRFLCGIFNRTAEYRLL